jgi:hypothetical protein
VKGNNFKKKFEKKKLEIKEKKKEKSVQCKSCLFYDWATEREFHRNGIREGLVEIRGICRCEKVRSYNRLVMAKRERQCEGFKEGKYEHLKKRKEKNSRKKKVNQGKTAPHEYHGPNLTNIEKKEIKFYRG